MYLQEYKFVIVYRKGALHSNVDAVSRPVLIAKIDSSNELLDNGEEEKIVEAYEDSYLLHFLKFKKHLPGASKRQIKRISRMSLKYKIDPSTKTLYYKSSDNNDYVIVPQIQEREGIIEKAHLLGHYNAQSTIQKIKQQYFWVRMALDVSKYINNCFSCKRMNREKIFHHPARPLQVIGLFERIGIDLIFGLPADNSERYVGILVITEYLSKYPFAAPIRSKEATEIADILFHYISIFGPPKTILGGPKVKNSWTIQGKEFVNEVMKSLLCKVGTEHRVTSAYHPNTNGQTERFNQTLISSLRKHCESHPSDWYKWIPYVLLSYRTRIHTTTGFSPFYLMFGREMLTFQNWTHGNDINEVLAIDNRTNEIKHYFDKIIPGTLKVINDKQKHQSKVQDNSKNVLQQPLSVGTTVYIKTEGLLSKLDPRFHGPFTIVKQTPNGNYKLKNAANTILDKSYPLEKLKLFTENEDTSTIYAVEKILEDRVFRRKQQYLVKWKDYPDSENSWENEENFVSMIPIRKYWENKDTAEQHFINKKKRVHQINLCTIPRVHFNTLYFILFLLFLFMHQILSQTVNGMFNYCDTTMNLRLVDTRQPCRTPLKQINRFVQTLQPRDNNTHY